MNIYIVKYWLPFPSSEYGGLEIVIASSEEECIHLLRKRVDSYSMEEYPDYLNRITETVKQAKRFALADYKGDPQVVAGFYT